MSAESLPAEGSRSLQFSDGVSNKFWKIALHGPSLTVTYGRVGTSGRNQTKDFESDEAARKAHDKLISEKLTKGYVDVAGDGTASASAVKTKSRSAENSFPRQVKQPRKTDPPVEPVNPSISPPSIEMFDSASTSTEDVDLSVTREIKLEPADWYRAGFRSRPPLERGTSAPFDQDSCLRRLAKLKKTSYGWAARWCDLKLSQAISAQEAHFWLEAMTDPRSRTTTMKSFADSIGKKTFDGQVAVDDARGWIYRQDRHLPVEVTGPLANLFSPEDYVELILENTISEDRSRQESPFMEALLEGFNLHVVPYLSPSQRESIRRVILRKWDPHLEPASDFTCFPVEYYVAAAIGMHDEVYEVTSRWADDRYQSDEWCDFYQRPQQLVFGLGSAELVEAEWRRLKLKVRTEADVRALLACTEYAALDCIVDDVLAEANKEKCGELLKSLALVLAPEAAEPMLKCKLSAKTPAIARQWLDKNVGRAVVGLIGTASGRSKLADSAIDYLRGVKRIGLGSVIVAAVNSGENPAAASRVQAEVLDQAEIASDPFGPETTPSWLVNELEAAGPMKKKSLTSWATGANLPPITVGENRLNDQQVDFVLQLLAATPPTEKQPLFAALRTHVSKTVLHDFVWRLFESWKEDGYPSKEKWAMGAIAHLGDDGCVLKLTPLIRNWPGESQHARAVFGLECLRAIGSSTALMHLAGIAQKLKFKGLKSKAEQFVTEIAAERGLTRDELEDRVVPDCGLDESGRREFSFGPRSFFFVLGGDLKAMVRDGSGKIRPNLPDPGAKDDPALSAESVAEWKLLKKQIKEVATIQAGRLEQAMVTGRRWTIDDFSSLLVRHPLMTHLVQKLIWAGFDESGNRVVTFRVTEERDFADPNDGLADMTGATTVGVAHPLELSDAEQSLWGQVLGDYEVVSPIPQLGRAVYSLEQGEEKTNELTRFHGMELVAPTLVFTLEKLGWTRGLALDAGMFDEHSKQFPAAQVTAVIGYEGNISMGYISPDELLTVSSVHFCPGLRPPSGYGWESIAKLKMQDVPPIVISEVMADLHVLKSKAK